MNSRLAVDRLAAALTPVDDEPPGDSGLRRAAVLVALLRRDADVYIPLIRRPEGQGVHGGQLALPGGAHEEEDKSLLHTALREAQEEIGLSPDEVSPLGRLAPVLVRVSMFEVWPYVAYGAGRPVLIANDTEVAGIVEVPVSLLLEPSSVRIEPAPAGSSHRTTYEYDVDGYRVWGATARILDSLARLLRAAEC